MSGRLGSASKAVKIPQRSGGARGAVEWASRGINAGLTREAGHVPDALSPPLSGYVAGLVLTIRSSSTATAALSMRPSATPMVSA